MILTPRQEFLRSELERYRAERCDHPSCYSDDGDWHGCMVVEP